MNLFLVALVALAGLALASLLAAYSYGRFVARWRGAPSSALPVAGCGTVLDGLVAPLLAARPGQSGLVLVADNVDAFAVRALSARNAGRSLDLQYYIWDGDLTGRLLAHELVRAADRGVRVRLLVDDVNARGFDRVYLALAGHPNIQVRLFNPSLNRSSALACGLETLLRAFRVNRRMHNKAWIADGRLALVGGRNIGDAYFDAAATANFRDLDLVLLGPAVAQAEAIFDRFWNSRAVLPITALGRRRRHGLRRLRARLAGLAASAEARPYLQRAAESDTIGDMLAGDGNIRWTGSAEVVSDPPEKVADGGRDRWLRTVIQPLLAAATQDVKIISPYFVPGADGTARLLDAVRRGVSVSVLTNSLAATDVAAVHGAYARYRRTLVEGGVALFELKPRGGDEGKSMFGSSGASLHTKAFTVDGRAGFVGSMNFDPRSISLNTEMGVVFDDAALAGEVGAVFADQTSGQKSYRILVEDGAIRWRHGPPDRTETVDEEPETSRWQRLLTRVIARLPIESLL